MILSKISSGRSIFGDSKKCDEEKINNYRCIVFLFQNERSIGAYSTIAFCIETTSMTYEKNDEFDSQITNFQIHI